MTESRSGGDGQEEGGQASQSPEGLYSLLQGPKSTEEKATLLIDMLRQATQHETPGEDGDLGLGMSPS